MGNVIDLTGKRFGRWTVIKEDGRARYGGTMWLCKCDCGTIRRVNGRSLRAGLSMSCGCYGAEQRNAASVLVTKKHGGKNERLYGVWAGIKERCNNPNSKFYPLYGGRGITICNEWNNDYAMFRKWALETGYDDAAPHGKCTLDRINNDLGYFPENCRWATSMTQCNNRRSNHILTFNGQSKTISEWARETGIRKDTIRRRIVQYGWSIERALTEKTHNYQHQS